MTRVADLASHNLTLGYMRQTQARQLDAQLQISSGKTAQRYSGIANQSQKLVSLEAEHARTSRYVEGNQLVGQRLQKMESAVAAAGDLASDLRTLLVNATNASDAADVPLEEESERMMNQLAGLLNEKADGRHLFAGSRIDAAPVDISALPADGNFTGTADADYYRGDGARASVRASDQLTLTYGVTADEPGFEKLVRALQMVRTADHSDQAALSARLEKALGLAEEAVGEIPDIRSRIGVARNALEVETVRHEESLLYTEQSIGDIENVDVTEAITRLSAEQTTLQASYAALARLQSLSLTDYLR